MHPDRLRQAQLLIPYPCHCRGGFVVLITRNQRGTSASDPISRLKLGRERREIASLLHRTHDEPLHFRQMLARNRLDQANLSTDRRRHNVLHRPRHAELNRKAGILQNGFQRRV